MGLAITVGLLADYSQNDPEAAGWLREQLQIINQLLAAEGLPAFEEPERIDRAVLPRAGSLPYSFLHTLRRFAAHCKVNGQPPPPLPPGPINGDDPVVQEAGELFDFHLLVHSDAEGYYVPIDFRDVLFDSEERGLDGGMLGSSVALLRELLAVAPALQVSLIGDRLAPQERARLDKQLRAEADPFWRERLVWLTLFEAAHASIDHRTMIAFH
jgi:hypothetical protein